MTLVIAHRGASAHEPENSLAAFRAALAQGADGVELDVRPTVDGALVVLHDAALNGRPVRALPLGTVRRHRLANGEPVPMLADALDSLGAAVWVCIELKALSAEQDEALFAAIDAAPAPDRCMVHAFDHRLVRRLARKRPGLATGVLSCSCPVDPAEQVRAADARVLWQHEEMIDEPFMARVRAADIPVYAWTVDDVDRIRELRALGVDGICTNRPDRAREAIR